MEKFLEELEALVQKHGVKIEALCDNVIGTPHAIVRKKGTEEYFNIDMGIDNGYEWGDPISF